MNKNYRLAAFYLVVLLTCGAVFGCVIVGFSAIPNNTLRQNYGAAFPTFNATGAGYFIGPDVVISATRAATFTTLDTGQGANELYPMDQAVRTTDAVIYEKITIQGIETQWVNLGGDNRTAWPVGGENVTYADTFTIKQEEGLWRSYYSNGTIFNENANAWPVINATCVAATANADGIPVWHQAKRVYPRATIRMAFDGTADISPNNIHLANHVVFVGNSPETTYIYSSNTNYVVGLMWSNYTLDYGLKDITILGENGVTDYPINFEVTAVPSIYPAGEDVYYAWQSLENVHVDGRQLYAIRVQTDGSGGFTLTYWDNVRAKGTIYINRLFDSMLQHVYCYGLILDSVSGNHFNDWYVGGANSPNVRLYGDSENNPNRDNIFAAFRSDNPVTSSWSVEGYSTCNVWVGGQCTNRNADSSTPAYAFIFTGQANHNEITGMYFGHSTNNATKAVKKFIGAVSFGANTHDNKVIDNQYNFDSFTLTQLFNGAFVNNNIVDDWFFTDPTTIYDNMCTGEKIEGTAGENLVYGEVCYLHTNGKYYKSDANATTTMFVVAMATASISADAQGVFLIKGYARDTAWSWTIGSDNPLFASGTPGDMTQYAPNTSGDQVQIIGYPISATVIRFDPDFTVVELT